MGHSPNIPYAPSPTFHAKGFNLFRSVNLSWVNPHGLNEVKGLLANLSSQSGSPVHHTLPCHFLFLKYTQCYRVAFLPHCLHPFRSNIIYNFLPPCEVWLYAPRQLIKGG